MSAAEAMGRVAESIGIGSNPLLIQPVDRFVHVQSGAANP